MSHPYFEVPHPIVVGHRGAAGEAPENTLASFRRALERGAHLLESDVHLTRDGIPVLSHDERVDRMTDASGPIAERTLAELQELDAGHGFGAEAGGFPYRGRGIRIPTLEEAFEALPGARFNLELKQDAPELVEAVVALVRRMGREEQTLLTAEKDGVMARLRDELERTGARPAVGACLGDVLAVVQSAVEGRPPPAGGPLGPMALQIPASFAGNPLVTPQLVEHAHAHGIEVHVWTINEEAEMERLLEVGVDGIVTDFPGRMTALLARRRGAA